MTDSAFPEPMETYRRAEAAIAKWVRRAQLDKAIAFCEQELSLLPRVAYHDAIGQSWLPQTDAAARWLGDFYREASQPTELRAIYCEMNRFEINTDAWYVDAFGYNAIGDPDDGGWLTGWNQSTGDGACLILEGLEGLKQTFQRDYLDSKSPSPKINPPAELTILLLTLRMQELIHAASTFAWRHALLPKHIPVLSAAHDADSVCTSATDVGLRRLRQARQAARKAPPPSEVRVNASKGPGIYKMDGGWDENGNSLPWDVVDYAGGSDDLDVLKLARELSSDWQPINVKLRKRKWRCDILSLYPEWAVTARARSILSPLLGDTVEFLPLHCVPEMELYVLHLLRHVGLAKEAVTDENQVSHNITVIHRYSFNPTDLVGNSIFRVSQPDGSAAGRAGFPCSGVVASDEFVWTIEESGLRGVVFEKVFAVSDGRSAPSEEPDRNTPGET